MSVDIVGSIKARIEASGGSGDKTQLQKIVNEELQHDKTHFAANRAMVCEALEDGGQLHSMIVEVLDGNHDDIQAVSDYVHSLVGLSSGDDITIVPHGKSKVLEKMAHTKLGKSLTYNLTEYSDKVVTAFSHYLEHSGNIDIYDNPCIEEILGIVHEGEYILEVLHLVNELDDSQLKNLLVEEIRLGVIRDLSFDELVEGHEMISSFNLPRLTSAWEQAILNASATEMKEIDSSIFARFHTIRINGKNPEECLAMAKKCPNATIVIADEMDHFDQIPALFEHCPKLAYINGIKPSAIPPQYHSQIIELSASNDQETEELNLPNAKTILLRDCTLHTLKAPKAEVVQCHHCPNLSPKSTITPSGALVQLILFPVSSSSQEEEVEVPNATHIVISLNSNIRSLKAENAEKITIFACSELKRENIVAPADCEIDIT